jgi:biotin transporter BioY
MTTLLPTIYARTFPGVAALAQIEIPLPFTPVPITGQTFGVLLVGAALGSKRGRHR